MKITTMGIDEVERFEARGDEACISIAFANGDGWDNGRAPARLSPMFREVLRLAFDDCGPHMQGHPNSTIDLSPAQAWVVVAFAKTQAWAGRDLIIHCGAGMSRSVAIAAALDVAKIGVWTNPRAIINPMVFARIMDAMNHA